MPAGRNRGTMHMKNGLFAMMALALAACGGGAPEGAGGETKPAAAAASTADESVAAVLQSEGTALAQLRFVVESRPVAGETFTVRLVASAGAPVPALQLVAESGALAVVAGSEATLALEANGAGASHPVTLSAARAGLAELTVRLRAADRPETVYVVPLLVAAPAAG